MEKSERRIEVIVTSFAGIALCLLVLFGLGWILEEVVSTRMRMSFESAPPEGYSYWYWKEIRRQLPEVICYALPAFLGLFFLIRRLVRCVSPQCCKARP